MGHHLLIITICLVLIMSYVFNIISVRYKLPWVLLQILIGILLRQIFDALGFHLGLSFGHLRFLGTLGLILIVLEGSLNLEINRETIVSLKKSMTITVLLTCISSAAIAFLIKNYYGINFYSALIYSVSISVVSSAIVIPSINPLPEIKKNLLVFESTFSDIIGILLFNLLVLNNTMSYKGIANSFAAFLLTILISLFCSLFLIILTEKSKGNNKTLVLSILILLYSLGNLLHLSSLVLILTFGLLFNNLSRTKYIYYNSNNILAALKDFKKLNEEFTFVIRTLFFTVFGFLSDLNGLSDLSILRIGLAILALIYMLRYITLKLILKRNIFPEVLIAPRGLVTILLIYSIPGKHVIGNFENGITLFLIFTSCLIMTFSLILYHRSSGY